MTNKERDKTILKTSKLHHNEENKNGFMKPNHSEGESSELFQQYLTNKMESLKMQSNIPHFQTLLDDCTSPTFQIPSGDFVDQSDEIKLPSFLATNSIEKKRPYFSHASGTFLMYSKLFVNVTKRKVHIFIFSCF